ncbi:hypothetical protein Pcinc_042789 [Petrolisthes cinctipes]|uniref:Uncharacterized protein n=1 Tax=Petrolisthes cinctipes TaxID=88211 RepID=A0AAE1EIG8_PETCI|nr:hypothetical protein Pcinc_042789 [Petrolisthes cinctipes]
MGKMKGVRREKRWGLVGEAMEGRGEGGGVEEGKRKKEEEQPAFNDGSLTPSLFTSCSQLLHHYVTPASSTAVFSNQCEVTYSLQDNGKCVSILEEETTILSPPTSTGRWEVSSPPLHLQGEGSLLPPSTSTGRGKSPPPSTSTGRGKSPPPSTSTGRGKSPPPLQGEGSPLPLYREREVSSPSTGRGKSPPPFYISP